MQNDLFTCPFTGCDFTAKQEGDELRFADAVTGHEVKLPLLDGNLILPITLLKHVKTISAQETCMTLHISRQRLSQLVNAETLRPIMVGNCQYFIRDDVLEYKMKRKNGRPRKKH